METIPVENGANTSVAITHKEEKRNGTASFIRAMVEQSSALFERLGESFQQNQDCDPQHKATYLGRWAKALSSDGKTEKLQRFFEFENLGEKEIHQMLAPAKLKNEAPLPPWAIVLAVSYTHLTLPTTPYV